MYLPIYVSFRSEQRQMPQDVYHLQGLARYWRIINQLSQVGKNVCQLCFDDFTTQNEFAFHVKNSNCPIECPPQLGKELGSFFKNKFFALTPGSFLCQFGCPIETENTYEISRHLGQSHSARELEKWLLHQDLLLKYGHSETREQ